MFEDAYTSSQGMAITWSVRSGFAVALFHTLFAFTAYGGGVNSGKLLGFGALYFATPARGGGFNFLQGVRARPAVRDEGLDHRAWRAAR